MLRRKRKSSTDLRPEVMMTMEMKTKKVRVMKKLTMATMVTKKRKGKSGLLRISYNQTFKVTGSSVKVSLSEISTTMLNLTTS